ncbi:MAG: response regulator [Lachnospiraceae bacterium]|jgi:two-component system response regulator YesN|nr:response regulator [Lachnospiraceae bacterium]
MIKVMIADDEHMVRRTIRAVGKWEENGMEIIGEARNGIEALEIIKKEKPEVLFLDMRMPGLSGSEILERLGEREEKPIVVIVSGYDDFEYARKALKYGAMDYILKPIERNVFNKVLERIGEKIKTEGNGKSAIAPYKDVAEKIKENIEEEYAKDISLTYYAENFYMNKEVLSRLFKKKYGVGITAYINYIRLEQAKVLLSLGYSSTHTAEMVGYHDVNYFSRIFKKTYEMTTSEYVESINK